MRRGVPRPDISKPEPAQLAADLKKVAERFEPQADQHDKAPAAKAEPAAVKTEQKATMQPGKAVAEPPKGSAMPGRPEAGGTHNDKSFSQKN